MRRPGTRSNVQLLVSATLALGQLLLLIGGHLVLALWIWSLWRGNGGMADLAAYLGLPTWLLGLAAVGALALDVWIAYHARKQKLKALER